MQVTDLKQVLLDKAKYADVCGAYQAILIASTEEEIVAAGMPLLDWAYRTGIVEDSTIQQISPDVLAANNIFITGQNALTNPTGKVYCLGDASLDITLDGSNKCELFIKTTGVVNVTLYDQSMVGNKMFAGTLDLRHTGQSLSCNEFTNAQNVIIETYDTSVCHMRVYENSIIHVQTNDDSFMKVQGFYNAAIDGIENSSIPIDFMTSQGASYTKNNYQNTTPIGNL